MYGTQKTLIALVGPTASGKTALSIKLAKKLSCHIISADSRQFYREMNIGTARVSLSEMQGVPHHFIDFISIHNEYNAGIFEADVLHFLEKYFRQNNDILLVGGSGLYIQAVTGGMDTIPASDKLTREGLQEEYRSYGLVPLLEKLKSLDKRYFDIVDKKNPHRIIRALEVCLISGLPYSSFRTKEKKGLEKAGSRSEESSTLRNFNVLKIGIDLPREELYERINARVDMMVELGLVEEARTLFPYRKLNALQTVGYVELFMFLENKISLARAIELIKRNTRRYAKRQVTWFHNDPEIHWFNPSETGTILSFVRNHIFFR